MALCVCALFVFFHAFPSFPSVSPPVLSMHSPTFSHFSPLCVYLVDVGVGVLVQICMHVCESIICALKRCNSTIVSVTPSRSHRIVGACPVLCTKFDSSGSLCTYVSTNVCVHALNWTQAIFFLCPLLYPTLLSSIVLPTYVQHACVRVCLILHRLTSLLLCCLSFPRYSLASVHNVLQGSLTEQDQSYFAGVYSYIVELECVCD